MAISNTSYALFLCDITNVTVAKLELAWYVAHARGTSIAETDRASR